MSSPYTIIDDDALALWKQRATGAEAQAVREAVADTYIDATPSVIEALVIDDYGNGDPTDRQVLDCIEAVLSRLSHHQRKDIILALNREENL